MNKIMNQCNNCGKLGHLFHQCKSAITSYGIIVCRPSLNGLEFLMLRRKDSFGYIDFIRGKYSPYNIYQIQNMVNEMSNAEKKRIISSSFEELWENMWGETENVNQFNAEESSSAKKFELIKNGVIVNESIVTLKNIIENSPTSWDETEWEFPKGRRNYKEETGISQTKITIIENVVPFEEIYLGTNHKPYKHKYYIAYSNYTKETLNKFQVTEVSKLEWKTIDQCLESIRPYNLEKIKLIKNINKVLKEYRLYS